MILSGITFNLDEAIISTALPLFQDEKVEAIEWSFDTLGKFRRVPLWFTELLQTFSKSNRLIGHGIYFSLFSGNWLKEQEVWLKHLENVSADFQFDHVSEHFGFMTGENFHQGAPIGVPYTSTTLTIGQDRLKRIYHSCKCPVGLENLAFSYSLNEVKKHGDFLDELLEPVNGFLILDLHNLYCQLKNFNIDFNELIKFYPLHRVREIHISGGSWEDSQVVPGKKIRRDTHDDTVPEEVFELLKQSIPLCPHVKYVILEQLGNGLITSLSKNQFRQDFSTMQQILKQSSKPIHNVAPNNYLPQMPISFGPPSEDKTLQAQQAALSNILETASDYKAAKELLKTSILSNTAWNTENWEPQMLETAIAIAQKWKNGFN